MKCLSALTVASSTGWTNPGALVDGIKTTGTGTARATIWQLNGAFRCVDFAITGGLLSVSKIVMVHDASGTSRVNKFYVRYK